MVIQTPTFGQILVLLAGIAAITSLMLVGGILLLRWAALRIAVRVARAAEDRLTAVVHGGIRGLPIPGGVRDPATIAGELARIDRLARIMDRLIPLPIVGGVGLDAVLGLIPGVGDLISFAISSIIVLRAAWLGATPELISRLVAIQATDLLLGAIPVVGDLFDVVYKADIRSAQLLRDTISGKQAG